jgi:hypothetical protein
VHRATQAIEPDQRPDPSPFDRELLAIATIYQRHLVDIDHGFFSHSQTPCRPVESGSGSSPITGARYLHTRSSSVSSPHVGGFEAIGPKAEPERAPVLAIRKLPRWFKAVALLAPRRWHDELVTSAAALSDPRAIAKLQILRQTQSYFG